MRQAVPKAVYVRDDRLRDMCRALPCQLCGADGDGAGVTWAHCNWGRHGKGKSIKASDVYVAALCWACHSELDQGLFFDNAKKIALWTRAHVRTVATAIALGLWPVDIPAPPPPEDRRMPDPDLPASPPPLPVGVTIKTLIDGTIVRSDSPEWQDECLKRHKHLLNIRGRDIATIKGYIANVRVSEGEVAAKRLKDAYADDWADRKSVGGKA